MIVMAELMAELMVVMVELMIVMVRSRKSKIEKGGNLSNLQEEVKERSNLQEGRRRSEAARLAGILTGLACKQQMCTKE